MNSLAIWLDGKDDSHPEVELHINIWHTNSNQDYIEFGVLLKNYDKKYGNLNFSLPYHFDLKSFEDMSHHLKDVKLIGALFNTSLSIKDGHGKYFKVSNSHTNELKYMVMEINKNSSDLKIENIKDKNQNNYTLCKIEIHSKNLKKNRNLYLRFRIKRIGNIFREIATNKMLLDGYIDKKGIFEINVNMLRKLPSDISEKLNWNLNLSSINVFFMTDYLTDIIFESSDRKSARILENHIWDDYIGYKNLDIEKVVAYQWKVDKIDTNTKGIQDFNIFTKTLIRDENKQNWLLIIGFILFFGIIGGIIGNFITSKCFNGFSPSKECMLGKESNVTKELR